MGTAVFSQLAGSLELFRLNRYGGGTAGIPDWSGAGAIFLGFCDIATQASIDWFNANLGAILSPAPPAQIKVACVFYSSTGVHLQDMDIDNAGASTSLTYATYLRDHFTDAGGTVHWNEVSAHFAAGLPAGSERSFFYIVCPYDTVDYGIVHRVTDGWRNLAADNGAGIPVDQASQSTQRLFIANRLSDHISAPSIASFDRASGQGARTNAAGVSIRLEASPADAAHPCSYFKDFFKWIVKEGSSTPPVNDPAWGVRGTAPAMLTLSPGEGTKRLYAWAMDDSLKRSAAAGPLEFVFDATPPAISLFRSTVPSPTNADSLGIELLGDPDIDSWIVEEIVPPAMPVTPGAGDTRWAAKPATINLAALADGAHAFYAWAKDAAGNVGPNPASIGVTRDTTEPSVSSFAFSPALPSPAATRKSTLGFDLITQADVVAWLITESAAQPALGDGRWRSMSGGSVSDIVMLSGGDGSKTLYPWVKDAAGNINTTADASGKALAVEFDTQAPGISSFALKPIPAAGAVTNATSLDFDLGSPAADRAKHWMLTESNVAPDPDAAGWNVYAAGTSPTGTIGVPAGSGTKTVHAWVKDGAGNVGGPASLSFDFDRVAPVITLFKRTSPSPTNSSILSYELEGDSDIASWLVSETATTQALAAAAPSAAWSSAKPTISLPLPTPPCADVAHTLYAWARDAAGNISAAVPPITVVVDVTPPSVAGFAFSPVLAYPDWTASQTVGYQVTSPPGVNATAWLVGESPTRPSAIDPAWKGSGSGSIVLSPGDGPKTLHAWARDAAGNVSEVAGHKTLTVELDTEAPRVLTIDPWPDPADGTVEGRRMSKLDSVELTFSEVMLGADSAANYRISGASGAHLAVDRVDVAGGVYTVVIKGVPADPTEADPYCRITLSGITDKAGNALEPTELRYALQAPTDAYLLLDVSGSMNSAPAGTSRKKVEYLRDSADAVASLWSLHSTNGDRLGIVTFSTYPSDPVATSPADPLSGLVDIQTQAGLDTLRSKIAAIAANGSTALGAGLATVMEKLDACAAGRRRSVILFSDGMQNQEPKVDDSTAGTVAIKMTGPGASHYAGSLTLPFSLDSSIPVHSIGIGAAGTWHDLLHSIATATGGNYHEESELWPNLTDSLVDDFVDCFRNGSPQVLKRTAGLLSGPAGSETSFKLNRSARRLTALVTWPEGGPVDIELQRDGKTLSLPTANVKSGSHFRLYSLIVDSAVACRAKPGNPARASGAVPAFDGTWKAIARKSPAAPAGDIKYSLTLIVEDHGTDLDFRVPALPVFVGEKVELAALLCGRCAAIQAVHSIEATVIAPRNGFGDVLDAHKAALRKEFEKLPDDYKVGTETVAEKDQLLPILLAGIKGAGTALGLRQEAFAMPLARLSASKAWTHGAVYVPTVPGLHEVVFAVRATAKDGSEIERTERRAFVARLRASSLTTGIKAFIEKEILVVEIHPADSQGHFIGAGYGGLVGIETAIQHEIHVVDRLDGSYEVRVKLGAFSKRLDDRIRVSFGETVWAGELGVLVGLSGRGAKTAPKRPAGKAVKRKAAPAARAAPRGGTKGRGRGGGTR